MATPDEMEIAGQEAEQELRLRMGKDPEFKKAVEIVASFYRKWYLKAGYKRLSRALLNAVK